MGYLSDSKVKFGPVTETTAKQIQDLLIDKGAILGSVGTEIDVPVLANEPMLPGTTTHFLSTTYYVDSGGHVHAVLIDERTTSDGTVLEILADVPIN